MHRPHSRCPLEPAPNLHGACGGGAALRLRGKLNPGTATIGSHFVYVQGGRVRAGKFSLTKQAG